MDAKFPESFEHLLRSTANRVGAAMIVVGLLVSSALMARVSHAVSLVGFLLAAVGGVYMLWRIIRTPGAPLGEKIARGGIFGAPLGAFCPGGGGS